MEQWNNVPSSWNKGKFFRNSLNFNIFLVVRSILGIKLTVVYDPRVGSIFSMALIVE